MVGVELGVGKSLPSLSLPGTVSVSTVDGGVLRSSARLSTDPRALPDELSTQRERKQTGRNCRLESLQMTDETVSHFLPLRRRAHGVEMFLCGRRGTGRGGRNDGDRVIGGVVAAAAAATVPAAAVVACHVVIAVGPPWCGAAGDTGLKVGVVIDVGAVRRRRRHGSCTQEQTDNFRFFPFFLSLSLSLFSFYRLSHSKQKNVLMAISIEQQMK